LHNKEVIKPQGQTDLELKILASTSMVWPLPQALRLGVEHLASLNVTAA